MAIDVSQVTKGNRNNWERSKQKTDVSSGKNIEVTGKDKEAGVTGMGNIRGDVGQAFLILDGILVASFPSAAQN